MTYIATAFFLTGPSNHIAITLKGNLGELRGILGLTSWAGKHIAFLETRLNVAVLQLSGDLLLTSLFHKPVEIFGGHAVNIGILHRIA